MGTFAEKAKVDCRLSFVDQGKTNFRFPFAENKGELAVSVFRLQHTNGRYRFLVYIVKRQHKYIYIYISINPYQEIYLLPFQTESGSPGPLIRLPFVNCANGVGLQTD
jgi:hypothetical protein